MFQGGNRQISGGVYRTMQVKPASGLVVRDPGTLEPLPAEGGAVELTTYWQRRLRDGDVVEVTTPPVAETKEQSKNEGKGK